MLPANKKKCHPAGSSFPSLKAWSICNIFATLLTNDKSQDSSLLTILGV
jgi:hypothetical protein